MFKYTCGITFKQDNLLILLLFYLLRLGVTFRLYLIYNFVKYNIHNNYILLEQYFCEVQIRLLGNILKKIFKTKKTSQTHI